MLDSDPRKWDLADVTRELERVVARGVAQALQDLPEDLRLAMRRPEVQADLRELLDRHRPAIEAERRGEEAEERGREAVRAARARRGR